MLSSLLITLNSKIDDSTESNDMLLSIESYRHYIIAICDNEPEQIKNILNFKDKSYPKIIFSKPQGNQIRIFGIGDDARLALNSILVNILAKGFVKIRGKRYSIKGSPKIAFDLDIFPQNIGVVNRYTTLTPICIFNRRNIVVYQAIMSKHLIKNKPFLSHSKEVIEAVHKELSIFATKVIKENIKYMLSVLLNKDKESFLFVDQIDIKWKDFGIMFAHYHREEKKLPMVHGMFESNFKLPKFIGYKIGKGFGELSLKNRGVL